MLLLDEEKDLTPGGGNLSTSDVKRKSETDRWIGSAAAVLQSL